MSSIDNNNYSDVTENDGVKDIIAKEILSNKIKQNISSLNEDYKNSITYKQLSRLNIDQRLYFVTKNKVKPSEIVKGRRIIFDFNGNIKLYNKTSAGFLFPLKVKELEAGGKIWIRDEKNKEFFNINDQKHRLIIGNFGIDNNKKYSEIRIRRIEDQNISKTISVGELFSNIKNYNELKSCPINYRLQNVSDFVGDSSNLEEGNNIKIDFSKGIGLGKASLGEIMPINIRSIKNLNGEVYTRLDNNEFGEFLDKNMNRLRVNHGDMITVIKFKKIKEIEFMINNHKKKINSLEYKKELYVQISILSKKYSMPRKYILALLRGENEHFDYLLKVRGRDNTAFGLLQMINSTWNDYGKGLDRKSISGQLIAGFDYLNYIKDLVIRKNYIEGIKMTVDELWLEVITLYHTGPNILSESYNNREYISKNLKWNIGIRKVIAKIRGVKIYNVTADNVTANDYLEGAKEYYKSWLI